MWHRNRDTYLDWAEKRATTDAKYFPDTVKLYERCLTACALHVEFWHRYARFLLDRGRDARAARLVFQRATGIFLKRRYPSYTSSHLIDHIMPIHIIY
jgi:hypothetical protein